MSKAIKWRSRPGGDGNRMMVADAKELRLVCMLLKGRTRWSAYILACGYQDYWGSFDSLADAQEFIIEEARRYLQDMVICASDALGALGVDLEDDNE